jgi:hypothetical protein
MKTGTQSRARWSWDEQGKWIKLKGYNLSFGGKSFNYPPIQTLAFQKRQPTIWINFQNERQIQNCRSSWFVVVLLCKSSFTLRITGLFWWILGLKYVLIDMWAMIKMKWCFSTSNCKILYLTMLVDCRRNLSQSDLMECKIITIEKKEKVFGGEPGSLSMFWYSKEIRWNGLQYAKV